MRFSSRLVPPALACLLAIGLFSPLGLPPLQAEDIHVDCAYKSGSEDGSAALPYRSLSVAASLAASGDRILVQGYADTNMDFCVYDENPLIFSGQIVLGMADPGDPNALPIIDGGRRGPVVQVFDVSGTTRLEGFIITGGRAFVGGGVSIAGSPIITGNVIHDNWVFGFAFINGASHGAGIAVGGDARITDNVIRDNLAVSGSGGGIAVTAGSPVITGNVISGNRAYSAFDAVYGYGGGIEVLESALRPVINSNVILGNKADLGGGGVDVFVTQTSIAGNTIAGNSSGLPGFSFGSGGGVQITAGGVLLTQSSLMNNLIIYNSSSEGGGGVDVLSAEPFFRSNNIFGNTRTNYEGSRGRNPLEGLSVRVGHAQTTGGNISIDPNLPINPALPITLADLKPSAAFSHIDGGNPGIICLGDDPDCPLPGGDSVVGTVGLGILGFNGTPRVLDSNSDGLALPEIGAFEFSIDPNATSDPDIDGIPTDIDPNSEFPCTGGMTAGCDDNCFAAWNPGQEDTDVDPNGPGGDGVGDVCDLCSGDFDPQQEDFDGDKVGDACDTDSDNDFVLEDADGDPNTIDRCTGTPGDCDDNCPFLVNSQQTDLDQDGVGDQCDNCQSVDNFSQDDTDGDAIGDDCDNCPLVPNGNCFANPAFCSVMPDADPNVNTQREIDLGFQSDSNGDGVGNACEPDLDDDGVLTDGDPNGQTPCMTGQSTLCDDNCTYTANQGVCSETRTTTCTDDADCPMGQVCDLQNDSDMDGLGDICDNCPLVPNNGICSVTTSTLCTDTADCPTGEFCDIQTDIDFDGMGDACDDDIDGDMALNDDPNSAVPCPGTVDPNSPWLDCDDNCPRIFNTNQADLDGDGLGDVCDDDLDGDLIPQSDPNATGPCLGGATSNCNDNCRSVYNPSQVDMDMDFVGDDPGMDPNIPLGCDNCSPDPNNPLPSANTFQRDLDFDGIGDLCDPDVDGDGILEVDPNGTGPCTGGATTDCHDNCPLINNPTQEDEDGDGIGLSCDNCPLVSNVTQANMDGDSLGDACDEDADGDLVLDATPDNCLFINPPLPYLSINPLQSDLDGDGTGDICDTDYDGDGILEGDPNNPCTGGAITMCGDNCPSTFNPMQEDSDSDGLGDACDTCPDDVVSSNTDTDGDGFGDACDNCPDTRSPSQADTDGDGIGNGCDRPSVKGRLIGPSKGRFGTTVTWNLRVTNRRRFDADIEYQVTLTDPGGTATLMVPITAATVPMLSSTSIPLMISLPPSGTSGKWLLTTDVLPTTDEINLDRSIKRVRLR